MLKVIIEKEIRDLINSTKFIITFGACALLIIVAFYIGTTRFNLNQAYYEASRAENTRSMAGLTEWNELENTRIFLPPKPLASLVSGVSNDIGRTAIIEGRGSIPIEDSRYNEDPVFAIFRFLDLEFIFKVILSLFAILLGYDAVSGEKERGTLRLSFANALPRQTYILGKLIGGFAALTISVLPAIAIGTLIMPMMSVSLSGDEWIRLLLIIMTGLLYASLFLTLSVFVSSLTSRSANSFLVLLVIWVICIHIVPRVSVLLAARSINVLSVDEIAYQKSSLRAQLLDEFTEGLENYKFEGPTDDFDALSRQMNTYIDSLSEVRDSKMQSFSGRLYEERGNGQKTQEKLAFFLARISPATSLSLATSYLAGTSIGLKNRFYDEARSYQGQFGSFMKEKTGLITGGGIKIRQSTACSGGGDVEDKAAKPTAIDTRELPEFKYTDVTPAESVKAAVADLGLLLLFNMIFFAGAFVAFVRYDVR